MLFSKSANLTSTSFPNSPNLLWKIRPPPYPFRPGIWLQAFRLHTLPLAIACIGLGQFVAFSEAGFEANSTSILILILNLLTAICLQILSNLANDWGDFVNGADNEKRVGPKRVVQSGLISQKGIRGGVMVFVALSFLSGISLLLAAIPRIGYEAAMVLLLIGLIAIAAAIAYTATKRPYGYVGLGDLSVLIFFGLAAVGGSYFLQTGSYNQHIVILAFAEGLLCAGVLNVNNIRDIESDTAAGKMTLAMRLGLRSAKRYHWFLLLGGLGLFVVYGVLLFTEIYQYAFLLPGIGFLINGYGVGKSHEPAEINPYLKQLVISILLFSLLFGFGLVLPKILS